MRRIFSKDPLLKLAIELGYTITPGTKHWLAAHPNGYTTRISFGRRRNRRAYLNQQACLMRGLDQPRAG